MRSLTKLLAVMFAALFFNNIANAACGKITYANMNWASASLMAVSYTHLRAHET